MRRRAVGVTSRYRGRIADYDLDNEMLHGSYFRSRLGEGIVARMAAWAREGDSTARLYLNDFGVPDGPDAGAYVALTRRLLQQGVPVGGIGCQAHLGPSIKLTRVQQDLDSLAQFGLPIKITEFDLTTTDEIQKAVGLDGFYRICFAHPAVAGIFAWGFWEGTQWIPLAALWRRDWTPTPAARAYQDLVYRQWWTREIVTADAHGECSVRAFYGQHKVSVGDHSVRVELTSASRTATVDMRQKPMTPWSPHGRAPVGSQPLR
jgi:GH35 family endo-1,4-beta-xylanase